MRRPAPGPACPVLPSPAAALSRVVGTAQWLALVRPLEQYRSRVAAPNPEDWHHDFREEIGDVIGLWLDPEARRSPPDQPDPLCYLIQNLQREDPSLVLRMLPLWPYVRTATRPTPTPGPTRAAYRRIAKLSAQLEAAITTLVGERGNGIDPWLDAQTDRERIVDDGKELLFCNPFLEDPPGATAGSPWRIQKLHQAREFAASLELEAKGALEVMDRTSGGRNGNPGKKRAQLLALLLLSIATRYAPAPTTPPGDPEAVAWRGSVGRFVHALTRDAALPTVNVKGLAAMLREPGARWATPAEIAARQGTTCPPS